MTLGVATNGPASVSGRSYGGQESLTCSHLSCARLNLESASLSGSSSMKLFVKQELRLLRS